MSTNRMNSIDVKEQVRRAILSEWPAFAASHPKMAQVVNEEILLAPAMQSLAGDAEYQEAMNTAAEIGVGAEAVADVIGRLVRRWLRSLI